MTETKRPAVYIEALCHFFIPPPAWWFDACVEDPEDLVEYVVIHSDGMFAEMEEAMAAGRAWAAEHGYAIREIEHDEEGEDD